MFEWREEYCFGISEIDTQHKMLFKIGRNLFELLTNDTNTKHYNEILNGFEQLKGYTMYHFKYEENLLSKYNFEKLAEHKQEHSAFIIRLNEIENQDIENEQNKVLVIRNILNLLSYWIEKHILESDLEYIRFLREINFEEASK